MKMMIKIILLTNNIILISQIEEVGADIGEPDCKLIEPFIIKDTGEFIPWCIDFTTQNTFMINSDKILTLVDPNSKLLEKYETIIK